MNTIDLYGPEATLSVVYSRCGQAGLVEASPEQARELQDLDGRLADPVAWLPATAWQDPNFRAYVPARFAICYTGEPSFTNGGQGAALAAMLRAALNAAAPAFGLPRTVLDGEA